MRNRHIDELTAGAVIAARAPFGTDEVPVYGAVLVPPPSSWSPPV